MDKKGLAHQQKLSTEMLWVWSWFMTAQTNKASIIFKTGYIK